MALQKIKKSWNKIKILDASLLEFWDFDQLKIKTIWNQYGIQGENVNVFVLDTGIDISHVAFHSHKITTKSFIQNEDPYDVHGHGTWCCGKINADKVGIAPKCNLFSGKMMDANGEGSDADVNLALKWALENTPHVVSMSIGGYNADKEQEELCKRIYEKGGIILAAAGNENTEEKTYPAAFQNVLAVTAIDQEKQNASFANFGQHIAIAAPGVACYSTVLDNQYCTMSGTSMATPISASLVALGISYIIKIKGKYGINDRNLVINSLEKSAIDLGAPGFDKYFGFGSIDGLGFMDYIRRFL